MTASRLLGTVRLSTLSIAASVDNRAAWFISLERRHCMHVV